MHAMILAAGRGERMRPLTDHTPKPLLPVAGKPLIVWHVERLVQAGIKHIVVNHAWLGDQIETALGKGDKFGAEITYSAEQAPLETAGGIARALPLLGNKPFLAVNGDIWSDWPAIQASHFSQLLLKQNKKAWLLMVDNPNHHPDGDFYLDTTNKLSHHPAGALSRKLTFSGIGIYQPRLFESISAEKPAKLAPLLKTAMLNHEVVGAHYNGCWVDVGTPARLHALDQKLSWQQPSNQS